MNFVEITGGLGNQLFQYTFSKYIEKLTGHACVLYTNFYDYVKNDPVLSSRTFDLDKFNTDYISLNGTVNYRTLVYENALSEYDSRFILDFFKGYWQDKTYYDAVSNTLKKEFIPKNEFFSDALKEKASIIQTQESVSMHVRRTDYLNTNDFASITPAYYEKALAIISENNEGIKVFIFSDDPDYIAGNYTFLNSYDNEIMPIGKAYEDMYLMSLTKHHIIANSTFSWWGAVLSNHNDGITIAPKNWYSDRPNPNLYFPDWITI